MRRPPLAAFLGLLLLAGSAAAAGPAGGSSLVEALRGGGYVVYFRHAATEWSQQDNLAGEGSWTSCEPGRMRQLSEAGRETARRIGGAMRQLGVPVARVLSSPYCRTRETAALLGLGVVEATPDIMNLLAADFVGGREAAAERARRRLSEPPPAGTNTVIVGHGNLMQAATGAYTVEAGAGVFRPVPGSAPELVVEVAPEDWIEWAARHGQTN